MMSDIIRIIVEDISFKRFIDELIERVKEYPKAELKGLTCGDDSRAENAFMFKAVLEIEE